MSHTITIDVYELTEDYCPQCKFQRRNYDNWVKKNADLLKEKNVNIKLIEYPAEKHVDALKASTPRAEGVPVDQEVFLSAPVWIINQEVPADSTPAARMTSKTQTRIVGMENLSDRLDYILSTI